MIINNIINDGRKEYFLHEIEENKEYLLTFTIDGENVIRIFDRTLDMQKLINKPCSYQPGIVKIKYTAPFAGAVYARFNENENANIWKNITNIEVQEITKR